jgi:hypothetical protein
MRAIEKPVAVFLHPRGMRFSYISEPWIERPQYSCNLPNCVKEMRAYYRETFEKICAGHFRIRRKLIELGT